MKDRDAAELSTVPFCLVLMEFRVHRLQERSDEGGFERRPHDRTLEPYVLDCLEDNKPICSSIREGVIRLQCDLH